MTAEEKALKVYPVLSLTSDTNAPKRKYFTDGYALAQQDYIEYAQLWVDSGEVNIKSFKQFLKDRGYE